MARSAGFSEEPQPFDNPADELRSVPYARLKIDSAGRIVIPAEMRAAMMVKPGDTVTAEVKDGEFRIVSPVVALKRFQAIGREWSKKHPGIDLADDLIADRREEARREADEVDAWRRSRGLPPPE